jgi:hypothetical protein
VGTRWLALVAAAALLVFAAAVLTGCGENLAMSDPAAVDDEEILREFVDEDGIFDDLGPYEAGYTSSGDRDVIDPLTFWRDVTERHRTVDVSYDPATGIANVTVCREVSGVLHILDEDMTEYEKEFHHTGLRYATFLKDENWEPPGGPGQENGQGDGEGQGEGVGRGDGGGQGEGDGHGEQHRYRCGPWLLTEISGYVGESDTLTVDIDYVTVQSPTADITIDDPLELMAVPDELPTFRLGEEVTVTVHGAPDDAILFLHTRRFKSPFVPQGGGVFTGTWTVERRGRHCAWVEAMAHDTIYDTEHPEDTLVWGAPYVVVDEESEEIE